jgi:predicted RNase H-like HicB family nuclease
MRNTKLEGSATVFIYKKGAVYIGVCLELDLVDEGKSREEVADRMKQAIKAYVAYVRAHDRGEDLLNRRAPKKYWQKFFQYLRSIEGEEKSPGKTVRRRAARVSEFAFYRQPIAIAE